jgi:hypothetical protein
MPSTSTTQRTSASGVARSFFSSLLAAVLTPASPSRRWLATIPGCSAAPGSAVVESQDRSSSSWPARGPSWRVAITPPTAAPHVATTRHAVRMLLRTSGMVRRVHGVGSARRAR